MRNPETLGQYNDLLGSIILCAPDHFYDVRWNSLRKDQNIALIESFEVLRSNFIFIEKKLKSPRVARICAELISMSFEAYASGDKKRGAHILQEFRGIVWPKYLTKIKYAIDAEIKAFGDLVVYKDIIVTPYPYEGSENDLGSDQRTLLDIAVRRTRKFHEDGHEFMYLSWVFLSNGCVRRTSYEPREDDHPILKPLQKSWGFKRLKELARLGEIRASVLVQSSPGQIKGLIIYDLEQQGMPRISARQLFEKRAEIMHYERMRYHLEDSVFFPV